MFAQQQVVAHPVYCALTALTQAHVQARDQKAATPHNSPRRRLRTVLKSHASRLVVGRVTTSESRLLYVFFFFFFCSRIPMIIITDASSQQLFTSEYNFVLPMKREYIYIYIYIYMEMSIQTCSRCWDYQCLSPCVVL